MGTDSRLNILARVRRSQLRARLPEVSGDLPETLDYPKLESSELLSRFRQELELLGVAAFVEDSESAVRDRVRGLIAEKSVLAWDAEHLPYGLGDCLEGKVYRGLDSKEEQGRAEFGLTGCAAALAETGSLAMVPGPGKPRTASLLPFTHVVVIRRPDILLGMGEFLGRFKDRPPTLFFITGPSRTADIELSLTLGVHGPGKVIAVIGP